MIPHETHRFPMEHMEKFVIHHIMSNLNFHSHVKK